MAYSVCCVASCLSRRKCTDCEALFALSGSLVPTFSPRLGLGNHTVCWQVVGRCCSTGGPNQIGHLRHIELLLFNESGGQCFEFVPVGTE